MGKSPSMGKSDGGWLDIPALWVLILVAGGIFICCASGFIMGAK